MKTMMEKAGECLQEKVKGVTDAVAGAFSQKKKKQCLMKSVGMTCGGVTLFCAGCWAGIHRNVMKALILGERMPRAPRWHVWCR